MLNKKCLKFNIFVLRETLSNVIFKGLKNYNKILPFI